MDSGIDSYTKLMLHCNGTDGSTNFPDSSVPPHVMTANGSVQVDIDQKKFGTGSAMFDGWIDYISTPNHVDFDFGAGDFTVDAWCYWATGTPAGDQTIVGKFEYEFPGLQYGWQLYKKNGTWKIEFYVDNGAVYLSGNSVGTEVWQHVAVVRHGSVWTLYQDGIATALAVSTVTISSRDVNLTVGGSGWLNGWLDEVRISKGIARWKNNFVPPDAEYVPCLSFFNPVNVTSLLTLPYGIQRGFSH